MYSKNVIKKKINYLLILIGSIFILSFLACEKDDVNFPEFESFEFPLAQEQNIDEERLVQVYNAAQYITGIKSLLVSRNGVLVSEGYFTEMAADNLYHVRSVTKSVVSALIGIAIDEGFIESTDQSLNMFIDPLGYTLDEDKLNITIEDLLTMSSGFQWNEFTDVGEYNNWLTANDQIEYVIRRTLVNTPGEVFSYNSATAHLLSVILTEATEMSTHDFAFEYLFEPLGLSDEDFSWGQFDQGYFNGGADLMLKPGDMIKIGELYLNNGLYNGNQIIPSQWVQESTNIHISTNLDEFEPDYGYLWWINNDMTYDVFFANGYGGQFIVVVPELELVVVATSEWRLLGNTAGQQWYNVMSLIMNEVLDCVE
ncbi:MAG: serine hydrolase [Bacteroidales bacterium]|nr:serine hydrolase [Bacteroidales bacterium]